MDGAFKEQGCTITLQQWDYHKSADGDVVMADFARTLETELAEAREALSGRTVSCSQCEEMAGKLEEEKSAAQIIQDREAELVAKYCYQKDLVAEKDAQIVALRSALERIRDGCAEDLEQWTNYPQFRDAIIGSIGAHRAIADSALSTPAPACVPVEDVRPLLDALQKIVREEFYPMSKRLMTDARIAEQAYDAYRQNHPTP